MEKRIKIRIGALAVLGMFMAMMLTPSVAANGQALTDGGNADGEEISMGTTSADDYDVFLIRHGVEHMRLADGITVFNENSGDIDLRIEGDNDANLFFADAGNDRVGIGTATPSAKVHIVHFGAEHCFRVDDEPNENTPFVIDQYGNVGIGTGSPDAKLDVEIIETDGGAACIGSYLNTATADFAIALGSDTDATGVSSLATGVSTLASGLSSTAMGAFTTASGTDSMAMGSGTTAAGYKSTAMGTYITVSSTGTCSFGIGLDYTSRTITQANTMAIMGGNVGIGTVSPTSALEVNGDIEVQDDDWIGIGSSSERIIFDSNGDDIELMGGNVGIGTTSPQRALHISDVMRLEPRSSAPSPASEGDIYVDSTYHHIYVYLGGVSPAWVQLDN